MKEIYKRPEPGAEDDDDDVMHRITLEEAIRTSHRAVSSTQQATIMAREFANKNAECEEIIENLRREMNDMSREFANKNAECEETIENLKREMNDMSREFANKNAECEATIENLKREMNDMSRLHETELKVLQNEIEDKEVALKKSVLHETHISLLREKVESLESENQRILKENLKFKKEISDLHRNSSVDTRMDSVTYIEIDHSEAVTSVSDLITELFLCNVVTEKELTPTTLQKIIDQVCTFATKLLSATKEQLSRAFYILAQSFYSKKEKNQLLGSYNSSNLEKLLKPAEFVVICGFENTMKNVPPFTEILKTFCTILEFELLTNGQLSHCRLYAAVSQLLNDPFTPFQISKQLLLRKEKSGLLFVATIGRIYPSVFLNYFKPDDDQMDIENKLFYNFILSKPSIMIHAAQCHHTFTTACCLPVSSPFNFQDMVDVVSQTLIRDFIIEPSVSLTNLVSVQLIALQMGGLWTISNILHPLLEELRIKNMNPPEQILEIIKVCSGPK